MWSTAERSESENPAFRSGGRSIWDVRVETPQLKVTRTSAHGVQWTLASSLPMEDTSEQVAAKPSAGKEVVDSPQHTPSTGRTVLVANINIDIAKHNHDSPLQMTARENSPPGLHTAVS
ncbi:hypothetical protein FRB99_000328 [Tulasnella sp. 403]|nr:hypothetical protein FRB99_000328 [Tulasnella sp. 403]